MCSCRLCSVCAAIRCPGRVEGLCALQSHVRVQPPPSAQFQCLPACLCPTPSCVQSLDSIASMHKLEYLNLPHLTPTYIWCWSLCVEQLNMLPCHELNLGMMSSRKAQKLHQWMYKYIQISDRYTYCIYSDPAHYFPDQCKTHIQTNMVWFTPDMIYVTGSTSVIGGWNGTIKLVTTYKG